MSRPTLTVVVLAYGEEAWLHETVASVLTSHSVDCDLVVVDNGCTSDAVATLPDDERLRVIRATENLGFAGGCNLGAENAATEFLALLNSDAFVAPDALALLCAAARDPGVGLVMAGLRLADQPHLMNSAGNPLHYTGLVWAGGLGDPADQHQERRDVASASGAALLLRTALWQQLGGFAPEYFAYHEDTELSWRCWQRGLRVQMIPGAVAYHHYEFSRNAHKLYLVERNRWVFLLTTYEVRTLVLATPALATVGFATLAMAALQGHFLNVVKAWGWLFRNAAWVRRRRRLLQSQRTISDRQLAHRLASRIDHARVPWSPPARVADRALDAYWRAARRLL